MVNVIAPAQLAMLLAAVNPPESILQRLDPPRRATVIMALLGLVITGIFLVALAMIGGHWARRLARSRRKPLTSSTDNENRRLRDALSPILAPNDAKTDDTAIINRKSDDTIADP
jgi:hypothetical protein